MARAISVKNYLSNSTQPFAQKLLTDIEKEEQQFQNTGQLSPEMMGQMQNKTPNEGIMRQALGVR